MSVRKCSPERSRNAACTPARAVTPDEIQPEAVDLLVNATSLGMGDQAGASPWPEPLPLPARWMVYDLVYRPAETPLLARARAAGAAAVGGLGMLVHQGALALELWTGQPAPLAVMRAAAQRALEGRRDDG